MKQAPKTPAFFRNGSSYNNVYFVKVDASGHSDIVRNSSANLVDMLFDLVEKHVYSSVDDYKKGRRMYVCSLLGVAG